MQLKWDGGIGGSQVFLQWYYVNAPLIRASFSLPKRSPTLLSGKLCCHLPAGSAQSGSARLSLVERATYKSTHLGSLQKQTTRNTAAWRNEPPRSFGPGVNDWLWTRSKLWSSWLSSGGWKRGEREQNDAPLERIKIWEDLMLSVFRNFNNMTKNT